MKDRHSTMETTEIIEMEKEDQDSKDLGQILKIKLFLLEELLKLLKEDVDLDFQR